MIKTELTVINELGLHARAANKLQNTCAQFSSHIQIVHNGRMADGKSILSLMMLIAAKGAALDLTVDGEDEERAVAAITQLINERFGESQ